MARLKVIDADLDTADADGLCAANVTLEAGIILDGALTSGGTYTAADGLGHIIVITDTGTDDQSGATFTITGTDANGQTISEAITGPAADATVVSTKFFKTVSSIVPSGTVEETDAVTIGTRGTTLSARSAVYVLDHRNANGAHVALDVTGTCNVDVLITFDPLLDRAVDRATFFVDANLAGETADAHATLPVGCTGCVLEVNTYSTGAEVQMTIAQPRD